MQTFSQHVKWTSFALAHFDPDLLSQCFHSQVNAAKTRPTGTASGDCPQIHSKEVIFFSLKLKTSHQSENKNSIHSACFSSLALYSAVMFSSLA